LVPAVLRPDNFLLPKFHHQKHFLCQLHASSANVRAIETELKSVPKQAGFYRKTFEPTNTLLRRSFLTNRQDGKTSLSSHSDGLVGVGEGSFATSIAKMSREKELLFDDLDTE